MKKKAIIITTSILLFTGGGIVGNATSDWFTNLMNSSKASLALSEGDSKVIKDSLEETAKAYQEDVENNVSDMLIKSHGEINESLRLYQEQKVSEMEAYFIGEKLQEARGIIEQATAKAIDNGKKSVDESYKQVMSQYK